MKRLMEAVGLPFLLAFGVAIAVLNSASVAFAGSGFTNVCSIALPGSRFESTSKMVIDAAGNVYICGTTSATSFPGNVRRFGSLGNEDVVVRKLDRDGRLLFTAIIGGESYDVVSALAVDSQGNIYVAGNTYSTNFPTVAALQATSDGADGFVCKLSPDGSALLYSTFIGGTGTDTPSAIGVASNGELIVAGSTSSFDFPVSASAFQRRRSNLKDIYSQDAFVARLSSDGSHFIYSTFFGGLGNDRAMVVTPDAQGGEWIGGSTTSPDFPTTTNAPRHYLSGPEDVLGTGVDIFLARFDNQGALLYSTYWDGGGAEELSAMAVDSGSVYLAGSTGPSQDSAIVRGIRIFDSPYVPALPYESRDAFVARVDPITGQTYSLRIFGGSGSDVAAHLLVSANNGPIIAGALGGMPFLAQLDAAGSNFVRFLPLGDCQLFGIGGIGSGPSNQIYVAAAERVLSGDSSIHRAVLKIFDLAMPGSSFPPVVNFFSYFGFATPIAPGQTWPTYYPDAADIDGTIESVAIYEGTQLVWFVTNAPYQFTWTNAPSGTHVLTAVATDNSGLSVTSCPGTVSFPAPPANDNYAASARVSDTSFSVSGTTIGATVEPQENSDQYPFTRVINSVWWCWTAPISRVFALKIASTNGSPTLTVFTGGNLDNLGTGLSGSFPRGTGSMAFKAVAGTTYHFRVQGYGDFTLGLDPAVPPPNDDYENRTAISGAPLSIRASNDFATQEPYDSVPVSSWPASVWWKWTALQAGAYLIWIQPDGALPLAPYVSRVGAETAQPRNNGLWCEVRAEPGQEFDISVGTYSGLTGGFELNIKKLAPPPNDNFENAQPLTGLPTNVTGALLAATPEPGEPSHFYASAPPYASVWYSWVAPSNTSVLIELQSSTYGADFRLYAGDSLENLIEVPPAFGYYDLSTIFTVTAGTEYHIAVDSGFEAVMSFSLTIEPITPPANDNFSDRIILSSSLPAITGNNINASREAGEPQHSPNQDAGATVWYSWTAPATGTYTIVVQGYNYFYGVVGVYAGSDLSSLLPVVPTNQYPAGSLFQQFSAVAGTQYQIAIASPSDNSGDFFLKIRPSSAPANDNFENATALTGANVVVKGTTIDATVQPGEPSAEDGGSVWYRWTAPSTGQYVVALPQSSGFGLLVFTGTTLSNLQQNAPIYGFSPSFAINAAAGVEYRILINNSGYTRGHFTLTISAIQPPPNDDFADAIVLNGSSVATTGTTLGATTQANESFPGGPSVWWSWTAPGNGRTTIKTSLLKPILVATGDSASSLSWVASSANIFGHDSSAIFQAVAGTTYRIRVTEYSFSPFTLTILGPPPAIAPILSGSTRLPDGRFQFAFEATVGREHVIETSADLFSWTPLATNAVDCSPYVFIDQTPQPTRRFYRVRTLAP